MHLCHALVFRILTYAVSVTWNGATLTGPTLIYHDELILDRGNPLPLDIGNVNRPGALVCRSETQTRAGWRLSDGTFFPDTNTRVGDIQQIRTGSSTVPSLARLSRGTTDIERDIRFNGLFTCRVQPVGNLGDTLANFIHVGIYARGGGERGHFVKIYRIFISDYPHDIHILTQS